MKKELRKAHIGVAWAILVLVVGFPFLHGNDGAMRALGLSAFAVGMAAMLFLDWREERARTGRTHRRSEP